MMSSSWIATMLADYDCAVAPVVAGPTCAKCGVGVDLPEGIGKVVCSLDCLPSAPQLGADGLPLPRWRVGYEPGRR